MPFRLNFGTVYITPQENMSDPLGVWNANHIVKAVARGSHENGDIFFQHREACNKFYDELPAVVEKYMDKVNAKLGTDYKLFNYYGAPDADRVIIAMGSINDVAESWFYFWQ